MKFTSSVNLKLFLTVVLPLVASAGCSLQTSESLPKAVEVGNPDDTRHGKPKQPIPMKLLLVELEPENLEEINAIEFDLKNIQLVGPQLNGLRAESSPENTSRDSKLTLRAGEKQILRFKVPSDFVPKSEGAGIEFTFKQASPGSVTVGEERIPIADRTESLVLNLDLNSSLVTGSDSLRTRKPLSKSDLFVSESAPTVSKSTEPGENPITSIRVSTYKLK
jgi:hypothetical protein